MGRRRGYQKIPNALFQDRRLTLNHIGLLVELNSHSKEWVVVVKDLRARYGIGEEVWLRLKRDLVAWGYLEAKMAYENGRRVGVRFRVFLDPKKPGVETGELNPDWEGVGDETKPRNTKPRKSGSHSEHQFKRRRRCSLDDIEIGEVIEPLDEGEHDNG
ncbi:hypothetical protein [Pseudoruegeria sp. SHC-113]|uniref:hypothetical protein n=1 Tax=Pseudoruegeria sp. SHC-113 TaxID=2855439 RepID=UPI0021BA84AA|nr:hypothetical protein [Pseudoruegeria sp. SHC-113]MCT8159999.1 hypothetical protein [Pseudoruegeria sp. SHC-113]